jgi:hypothetical protein
MPAAMDLFVRLIRRRQRVLLVEVFDVSLFFSMMFELLSERVAAGGGSASRFGAAAGGGQARASQWADAGAFAVRFKTAAAATLVST